MKSLKDRIADKLNELKWDLSRSQIDEINGLLDELHDAEVIEAESKPSQP